MVEKRLRFAADTGGTFTDLLVEEEGGVPLFYKTPTTPADPVAGLFDALTAVAVDFNCPIRTLLSRSDLFVFGTTRATNAIITGSTARTALLVTAGHPDILLFREGGGRKNLFDYTQEYPEPYIPRYLTFEVLERISSTGEIIEPISEKNVVSILERLIELKIEAVAISLLWSVINDRHEVRLGKLIEQYLPSVPYTLSSHLNPCIREYRRTSSACLDASLKPVMSDFLRKLDQELRSNGFDGRLLIMTSSGGVLDANAVAKCPIHSIGSGPAGAPVAGRYFATLEGCGSTAIVMDAGGTTFDVSLLRGGAIPTTRHTMVGDQVAGYITGFPSVDVRSIGAGGGSIAWVDDGGLLHVGPISAGADPGPACYNKGGDRPTVTDACLVLGYIDPDYYLGGKISVNVSQAAKAIERHVAEPLALKLYEAASAILDLAIDRMVTAIEEITLNQGIDPQESALVGGGGGAGLYSVGIAQRLNSWPVLIPEASAALSATGAMLSNLQSRYMFTELISTGNFDYERANFILGKLKQDCEQFISHAGKDSVTTEMSFFVEAHYPHQVWEIEVGLKSPVFSDSRDLQEFVSAFHAQHDLLFAVRDDASDVEIVTWGAKVSCGLRDPGAAMTPSAPGRIGVAKQRRAYFAKLGFVDTPVFQWKQLVPEKQYTGPLLVESPVTTLVIDDLTALERTRNGSILINPLNESR